MEDYAQYEWGGDGFEDVVARALIACFESNVKKNRGAPPADRLTEERARDALRHGLYIPSRTRVVFADDGGLILFDRKNDSLPVRGCVALPGARLPAGGYLPIISFRQRTAMGRDWLPVEPGDIYEMMFMIAYGDGLNGERRYATVCKDGWVRGCDLIVGPEPEYRFINETSRFAGYALHLASDRRFCWAITAQERAARADIGCTQEEIKSLLYARDLPMTATGRKRPVLHLVESHRRRIKNGTDIDITAFLRGVQQVEFGGTLFTVRPPEAIRPKVSGRSQEKYFAA